MPEARIKSNLHTHSQFCDGKNTMEEMVLEAIGRGFTDLGFSSHSYTEAEGQPYGMPPERMPEYLTEIARLREVYGESIRLYAGIEQEWPSGPIPMREQLDYVIAAHHFVEFDRFYSVDNFGWDMNEAIQASPDGRIQSVVENYYENLLRTVRKVKPDIVGHLDIIKMNNKGNRYFREDSGWYQDILYGAIDELSKYDVIIEVNTGGMARGFLAEPYPGTAGLLRIKEKGIPVTLAADAHNKEFLDFAFKEAAEHLLSLGFTSVKEYYKGEFVDRGLR